MGVAVSHLSALSSEDRRRLRAAGRLRRYVRREVIFHEGDPGDTLHFIDDGRVAVRVTTPMGEVVTLSVLGRGDAFGELALLDDNVARTATVVALEPTTTVAIRRDAFHALRAQSPAIDRFLLQMMSSYVRRLSRQVLDALYLPVDQRVVRRLAALSLVYATGKPDGGVTIPLTQEDVASLAGTSRATVNRVLHELGDAGIVSVTRGRIVVLDPARLSQQLPRNR